MSELHAGAKASNAGDDFHILWAGQKIISMLKPNNSLEAITLEGPDEEDRVVRSGDEGALYSIDLAEYYGGNSFENADKVVFSQLKYSTYQADTYWSVSDLCQATNQKKDNSIIQRLATTFQKYSLEYPDHINKLTLLLVSNRCICTDLVSVLKRIDEIQNAHSYKTYDSIKQKLSDKEKALIEQIFLASRLRSKEFVLFLTALSFDCDSQNSRSIISLNVVQELISHGYFDVYDSISRLMNKIRSRMTPDGDDAPITKSIACYMLKTDMSHLYPAKNLCHIINDNYILRNCDNKLIETIETSDGTIICVHGTAGTGKTSLVNHISQLLPENYQTIVYDCYGGGTVTPTYARHQSVTALTQICNEISTLFSLPLYIPQYNMPDNHYFEQLELRLSSAAEYLQNTNGKLVIILDAADNSMVAAKKNNEKCFISKLLDLHFPKEIVLVLTYRTERPIGVDATHIDIEIEPFSNQNSHEFLNNFFDDVPNEISKDFHALSGGIPRLQSFAVKKVLSNGDSIDHVLEYLKNSGCDLFSLYRTVIKEYNSDDNFDFALQVLACLPSPIPVNAFTSISSYFSNNVDYLGFIKSLCSDLQNGLMILNGYIAFRDEDFETFIHETNENRDTLSAVSQVMLSLSSTDVYCAMNIHDILRRLNDQNNLISLSLNQEAPAELIGTEQVDAVMRKRIITTLKILSAEENIDLLTISKLLYKLSRYCRSESSVEEMILDHFDIALSYCQPEYLQKLFEQSTYYHNDTPNFDYIAKVAYFYACTDNFKDEAKELIDKYNYELHRYFSEYEENKQYRIVRPNINSDTRIAGAILRCYGIHETLEWLSHWTENYSSKLIYELIVKYGDYTDVNPGDLLFLVDTISKRVAVVSAYSHINSVDNTIFERIFEEILTASSDSVSSIVSTHLLLLIQEYLSCQGNSETVLQVMNCYHFPTKAEIGSVFSNEDKVVLDLVAKWHSLHCALTGASFEMNDKAFLFANRTIDEKDKNELTTLIHSYGFWAQSLLNGVSKSDILSVCDKISRHFSYTGDYTLDTYSRLNYKIIIEGLLCNKSLNPNELESYIDSLFEYKSKTLYDIFTLAEILSADERTHSYVIELLFQAQSIIVSSESSAYDKCNEFIKCAEIAAPIDKHYSYDLFTSAVSSARGVDDSDAYKIFIYERLSKKLSGSDLSTRKELLARLATVVGIIKNCIGREDYIDFTALAHGLANTCPERVLPVIEAFDSQNASVEINMYSLLPDVVTAILNNGTVSANDALALLNILLPENYSDYNQVLEIILSELRGTAASHCDEIVHLLEDTVTRVIPLLNRAKTIEIIEKWMNEHSIQIPSSFIQTKNLLESINNKVPSESHKTVNSGSSRISSELLAIYDYDINEAKALLRKLSDHDRKTCLQSIVNNTNYSNHLIAINFLFQLICNDKNSYQGVVIEVLLYALNKWQADSKVLEWQKDANNLTYCLNNIHTAISFPRYSSITIETILPAFRIQENGICGVICNFLCECNYLQTESVLAALHTITNALSPEDSIALMDWCLNEELSNCPPNDNTIQMYLKVCNTANDEDNGISYTLWRMFGRSKRAERLLAAHSTFALIQLGHINVIKHMIQLFGNVTNHAVSSDDQYFFIDSARVMFLAVCECLVRRCPDVLEEWYPFFRDIACYDGTIHALQRQLAQSISLELATKYHQEDIGSINASCEMRGSYIENVSHTYWNHNYVKHDRFYFDITDTVPYWYSTPSRIFCISPADFANRCEPIIVDHMRIDDNTISDWHSNYLSHEDYSHTYFHKYSIPPIESLHKYAELHSMMIVADELRRTNDYSFEWQTYNDWLSDFLPGDGIDWTFDKMTGVPFLKKLDKLYSMYSEEIETAIENKQVFFTSQEVNDFILNDDKIILHANISSTLGNFYQNIDINSTLIKTDYIGDLVDQLNRGEGVAANHYLDDLCEGSESTDQIVAIPLDFVYSFSDNCCDKYDPFVGDDANLSFYAEPKEDTYSLAVHNVLKSIFDLGDQSLWNETYHNWVGREEEISGNSFTIDQPKLLSILNDNKCVLMVDYSSVSYKRNRMSTGYDDSTRTHQHQVLLLGKDNIQGEQ